MKGHKDKSGKFHPHNNSNNNVSSKDFKSMSKTTLNVSVMDNEIEDEMEKVEETLEWVSKRYNEPLDELRFAYENYITDDWLNRHNVRYVGKDKLQ